MDTKALANTRCNPHQLGNERGTYLRDVSASSVGAIKLPAVVEAFYLPGVRNLCQIGHVLGASFDRYAARKIATVTDNVSVARVVEGCCGTVQ